jgi:hypothetical protein
MVIDLKTRREVSTLKGKIVINPETRYEYLKLCKDFLEENDYVDVLCGVMDDEIYETIEPQLKNIVDTYYKFEV